MLTDLPISLGQILHTLIQSTYHDLSQLSELLHSRSDMERKIQLAKFSLKANHQFVRLLALAIWASSPETSNNLSTFTSLLDTQSKKYVETADTLYLHEKELKGSGLPQFCIVSTIDILRSCNYLFLPTCISKRLISLPTISEEEKLSTLHKLDQNLRVRLINLVPSLPFALTASLKLRPKGCLTMRVPNEFGAKLTLISDDPLVPWRLIQLDFLVRDQTSFDNRPLIHSQQKLFLQLLVQSRLFKQAEDNVLTDAYQLLHSFCISLQLQVLYTQLIQLTKHWGKHNLEVEEYIPGDKLRLAYWYTSPMNLILDMHCSITISAIPSVTTLVYFHCDTSNAQADRQEHTGIIPHTGKPLSSEQILIDRLIHLCIEDKSYSALDTIKKTLWNRSWPFSIRLLKSPPALILNLGFPDISNSLVISKDPRNGRLQCIIYDYDISSNVVNQQKGCCRTVYSLIQKHLDDLARGLFDHINYSVEYLTQFRAQYRIWFFEQQILEMNMRVSSKLPILNEETLPNIFHIKDKDSKILSFYFHLFVQLQTPYHYLMLSVSPDSSANPGRLNESMHLLQIQGAIFTFHDISSSRNAKNKLDYIDICVLKELSDKWNIHERPLPILLPTFLSVSKVYHLFSEMSVPNFHEPLCLPPLQRRRLQTYGADFLFFNENMHGSASKLSNIIFLLDTLISLFHLQNTLINNGCFEHFLVHSQRLGTFSRSLILVKPLCPASVSKIVFNNFCKSLLYCRIYLIPKQQWIVQLVHSSPLIFSNTSHFSLKYPSFYNGEYLFERFSSDLECILMLYSSLVELSVYMKSSLLFRKKCCIQKYAYTHISISLYAEEQEIAQKSFINISWNSNEKKFRLEFLNCPQSFAQSSFEESFNSNYSIPQLIIGLSKLFLTYRVIEQSTLNSRMRFQASPTNPCMIRLVNKLFIDFEICTNSLILIHPHESTERLFSLLDRFIESFKISDVLSKEHDISSLHIPAVSRSYSIPGSPGFSLKPFSPASKFTSLSQTPYTSKSSPFFPNTSTFISKAQEHLFPMSTFEFSVNTPLCKYATKTINFSTFKQLVLPKKKTYNSPLANFLAAVHLLDYERLVNFGHLPTLESSRILLEPDSFCIHFDNINVTVFLESNFMDLGIKLALSEYTSDHTILNDQDIFALESCFHSSKIKSPMFSTNALCCYLKLMSSHANLIQTAAFIFRNFRTPPNDWLWQPELCLTVPDHSLIMPFDDLSINPGVTCLFSFPNRTYMLYLRFLHLRQEVSLILDLILVYDYKQNRIDMKTYGISASANFESIGNSIRKILSRVNSHVSSVNDSDCSLLLAVKEISNHLEL